MASNQDSWEQKGKAEEARFAKAKEQEQLATLKKELDKTAGGHQSSSSRRDEIEGGHAPGMEDLEDRYATTSGEH